MSRELPRCNLGIHLVDSFSLDARQGERGQRGRLILSGFNRFLFNRLPLENSGGISGRFLLFRMTAIERDCWMPRDTRTENGI